MSPLPTIVNNRNLSSRFHKTLPTMRKKESDTDIQTVRKNRLAERCRGRLHGSAWGRACLDIDASQEPRCRPTPLCRASGRTSSDSTLRNLSPSSRTTPSHHPERLSPSSRTTPSHHPERLSPSSSTTHYVHPVRPTTSLRTRSFARHQAKRMPQGREPRGIVGGSAP